MTGNSIDVVGQCLPILVIFGGFELMYSPSVLSSLEHVAGMVRISFYGPLVVLSRFIVSTTSIPVILQLL